METENIYLQSVIKRFTNYKELGDKTFDQLNESDLHYMPNEDSNSIAIVVQHMHGNMLSRWTDFLTTDGEKDWRQRDAEFEEGNKSKGQIINLWEQGWACVFDTLSNLQEGDLTKSILIRGETLSVTDAINRQLAHYPYHVGQIIYIAKLLKGKDFKSLSIPKNKSAEYNKHAEGYKGK